MYKSFRKPACIRFSSELGLPVQEKILVLSWGYLSAVTARICFLREANESATRSLRGMRGPFLFFWKALLFLKVSGTAYFQLRNLWTIEWGITKILRNFFRKNLVRGLFWCFYKNFWYQKTMLMGGIMFLVIFFCLVVLKSFLGGTLLCF